MVKRKRGKMGKPVQSIVTNRPIRSKDDCGLVAAYFSPRAFGASDSLLLRAQFDSLRCSRQIGAIF